MAKYSCQEDEVSDDDNQRILSGSASDRRIRPTPEHFGHVLEMLAVEFISVETRIAHYLEIASFRLVTNPGLNRDKLGWGRLFILICFLAAEFTRWKVGLPTTSRSPPFG